MKSCSTFAVLLVATFSTLNASAYQADLQQATGTAASRSNSAPAQLAANPGINSVATVAAPKASPSVAPTTPRIIPLGSTLVAEFSGSLNAKKLKVGEKVKATLAQDLILGGRLVARSGSKVLGYVTEAKRHTKDQPESRLGVVFNKILLKKHREVDFEGIVLALAPPVLRRSRVDEPDQMLPPLTVSPGSSGTVGSGRGSGGSGRSVHTNGDLGSSSTMMNVPITSVQSTLGSNPGDAMSTMRNEAARGGTPISGGVGMHGVYGLKNLALAPPAEGVNSGPAIVSTKSDVKLQNGTQVVMLVVN